MPWQLPLIMVFSFTSHKSQSITAHNGLVAILRATDLDKVTLLLPIRTDHFITDKSKLIAIQFLRFIYYIHLNVIKYLNINIKFNYSAAGEPHYYHGRNYHLHYMFPAPGFPRHWLLTWYRLFRDRCFRDLSWYHIWHNNWHYMKYSTIL